MPILSFSSNDIDVITGKKTRTIRKAWKTPLKVGDRLYCYWNLVSKEKMKILKKYSEDKLVIVVTHDRSVLSDVDILVEMWDGKLSNVVTTDIERAQNE